LLGEADSAQLALPLEAEPEAATTLHVGQFISQGDLEHLGPRARQGVEHAVLLFGFMSTKSGVVFSPVFQPLLGPLDEAAEAIVISRLSPCLPQAPSEIATFFDPLLADEREGYRRYLLERIRTLRRLLVYGSPIMPIGVLLFCLEYAAGEHDSSVGVLKAVRDQFRDLQATGLAGPLREAYDFRNTYVAHEKGDQLRDVDRAREALGLWIGLLVALNSARSD
jgi:type III restriction enzyme